MQTFKDLKPESVWKYFRDIASIPRPSKKEEKILEYISDFARKQNLDIRQDATGNIIVFKPATEGYEKKEVLVLQSHVDMVCEKNQGVQHNFETDPIEVFIESDWVKAKGTTLGADNGIGIAIQLAILADKEIEHGPLECLFTVDEETGMTGANGLENNFFTGSILINLDSEDEGEIFIGCAGGIDTLMDFPVNQVPIKDRSICYKIEVQGLLGGHSGDDINKPRGNAIKILTRLLYHVAKKSEFALCTIKGGNLRNAIPRESSAVIAVNPNNEQIVHKLLNEQISLIINEYSFEKDLKIDVEPTSSVETCFDQASQKLLISCLHICPNGVIAMSSTMPDLVETSTNLASIALTDENTVEIVTSQRSSKESAKKDIASRIESLFLLARAIVIHSDSYPGWSPDPDSEILRVTTESYKRLYRTEPKIKAIHAGLECGLFLEKNPQLDMVSIGPTILGAHSPDERMEISSVKKFWNLILEILKTVPERKE